MGLTMKKIVKFIFLLSVIFTLRQSATEGNPCSNDGDCNPGEMCCKIRGKTECRLATDC